MIPARILMHDKRNAQLEMGRKSITLSYKSIQINKESNLKALLSILFLLVNKEFRQNIFVKFLYIKNIKIKKLKFLFIS